MLALMSAHVDELGCSSHGADCRLDNLFRRRDERDYRTIVIGIDMRIEHTRGFNGGNRVGNQPHRFRSSSFAEVWNTFNQRLYRHR